VRRWGDVTDFEDFAAASMPGLLRFGHVLTGDAHRAEELVQQALVNTWSRWRHIQHEQPTAYVRRAMVHTHTSWWRRGRREVGMPVGFDQAAVEGQDLGERDQMVAALQHLPPRQRAVIVLRYYEDLSEAEIAAVLGCSTGTVKSQASRALKSLGKHLTPISQGATHD